MTDEQIIKALECCKEICAPPCGKCPLNDAEGTCEEELLGYALDLINRQKAEIDALYEIDRKSDEEIHELRTELIKRQNLEESFCKTMHKFDKRLAKTVKLERAEAIKEFAEFVKNAICENTYLSFDNDGKPVSVWNADGYKVIDDLVKEIMEGK